MASNNLVRQVVAGESLKMTARVWNRVIAATAWVEAERSSRGGDTLSTRRDALRAWVKNSTGSDVNRFGILAVNTVPFSPTDNPDDFVGNRINFTGETPSGKRPQRFCVAESKIEDGTYGRCLFTGVTQVKLIGSQKIGVCGPIGGDLTRLSTHRHGSAAVLYDEGDQGNVTTERWGIVLLGGATGLRLQGVLNDSLSAPSAGWTAPTTSSMSVYVPKAASSDADNYWTTPREFEDSGVDINVVNRDPSLSANSGAYCKIEWLDGEFSPYWVGCP